MSNSPLFGALVLRKAGPTPRPGSPGGGGCRAGHRAAWRAEQWAVAASSPTRVLQGKKTPHRNTNNTPLKKQTDTRK